MAATVAIMVVLAFRIAAGGSDLPRPSPTTQSLSLEAEASLLLGNLASDAMLAARSGDAEFTDEATLGDARASDGFKDLGQSAAFVLLSALAIASGLVGAIWLKDRLSY